MKRAMFAIFFVLTPATRLMACTCIASSVPACQQVNAKRTALFVGRVEHIGSKTVLLPPDNYLVKMQVITFQVLEAFGPSKATKLVVSDWTLGNGSCGFPFVEGNSYLVDASPSRDDSTLRLNSCGYTAGTADAEELLRFLRAPRRDHAAILFGTVKEYGDEKNFVSKSNKPISGATVVLSGLTGKTMLATDNSGWYLFHDLASGNYVVQLRLGPEYRAVQAHHVALSDAGCADLDFRTERKIPPH